METDKCVNSRRTGGANVYRKGIGNLNGVFRNATAGLLAVVLFASMAGVAAAELPAPSWMPNSPLMAGTQVIVLWLPVPGATKYNLYMNDKKVGEATSIQHIIPAPEDPGEYKLQISSVDASGKEGAKGVPGIIRIVSINEPKGVMTRLTESTVLLRWDKVQGAVVYNVYRAEKKDGAYILATSVQNESASDKLAKGKNYYYYVTAKDLAGKESKKSEIVSVSTVEVKAVEQVVMTMKIVPSKETSSIVFIGKQKVASYSDFKIGPDGFGYMVDSNGGNIRKVNLASGDVDGMIGETGRGEGKLEKPTKVAVAKDGTLFVGDYSGKIVVFGPDGTFKYEFRLPIPDKEKDKAIYEGAQDSNSNPYPAGLLLDETSGTLYAAVPRFNTIYVFSADGKFKGYIGQGGKMSEALALPTEIIFNADKTKLIISQPPTHEIRVWDIATKKQVGVVGARRKGFLGGFIGMNGMTLTPKGDLLVCDSGIHSIQVFDGKTFDYLYHVGGETPGPDPEFKERAKFDFPYPVGGNIDGKGNLYIVNGMKTTISVRQVSWDKPVEFK